MTWRAFIRLLVTMLGLSGVKADALPAVKAGVSRRAFLRAMGVSAVTLASFPETFALDAPLDLDEAIPVGVTACDLRTIDGILKHVYEDFIVEQLNAPPLFSQLFVER